MPHYDLSKESTRLNLRRRGARYWHQIAPGRSLGVYVGTTGIQLWKARYRAVSGLYKETTLGRATGEKVLSFEQAVDAAERWFQSDSVQPNAVSRHAIRYNGQLTICPCGPEFTVGHALRDYVEWKRIAAAKSHFSAVVTLINHHLVPRIASIPLAQFNGRDFNKLCIDVLETPPKYGNQPLGPRRSIADLEPEALRCRKKTMNSLKSARSSSSRNLVRPRMLQWDKRYGTCGRLTASGCEGLRSSFPEARGIPSLDGTMRNNGGT